MIYTYMFGGQWWIWWDIMAKPMFSKWGGQKNVEGTKYAVLISNIRIQSDVFAPKNGRFNLTLSNALTLGIIVVCWGKWENLSAKCAEECFSGKIFE